MEFKFPFGRHSEPFLSWGERKLIPMDSEQLKLQQLFINSVYHLGRLGEERKKDKPLSYLWSYN
jgi:hypothetical protein